MKDNEFFEHVKSYKFIANKSLGQNFLIDEDVANAIVSTLSLTKEDKVLEIGAGIGSLSYYLSKSDAKCTLIDVDERMINILNEEFGKCPNIEIARQNILKADLSGYTKIIGNLPYYITSGIIEYLLLNAKNATVITLMTQKEVYQKLIDKKEVSPLSLLLHYVTKITSSKTVGRNSFAPIPHVDSTYFTLIPNENIKNEDNKALYKLMCKIFLHKRKTILNCLSNVTNSKEISLDILQKLNVSELKRPEQLDINFYIDVLNILKSNDFITKIL
ncbi:MAG: 16S rRNA (adenine(1518)-N(6)/adenine(1519)-N(6))-dimethyltransferase RsmA [Bacilli bacterium]|nr:16S rRNA (adenine(1518)-N(6)/adenine(1519)-N(6))-dimethyltransferase RsmA [Bacilli bacterium]